MFCPRCGREAAPDALFCTFCGARLPAAAGTVPPAPAFTVGEPGTQTVGTTPAVGGSYATVAPGWPPAPAEAPAAAPAVEVRYGGFWRRAGAFFIDGMLLWIAGALLRIGMGTDVFSTDWQDVNSATSGVISMVGGWLYCAILESSPLQGTLGQRAAGLKVTDLALHRISFMRATGRHFGQLASALTLGFGYLMIAFTARKQALHDIMSGCLVVKVD